MSLNINGNTVNAAEDVNAANVDGNPGSALPIIAGLRADRHARPRNARRIDIEGGPAEDAARLQPLAGVKWKCGPETCAQIHPGPVEERRRRFGSACERGAKSAQKQVSALRLVRSSSAGATDRRKDFMINFTEKFSRKM